MAHALGMRTVAEGVETPEQLRFLKEHGCYEFQGYLFSKPMRAVDVPQFLSTLAVKADAAALKTRLKCG